jgi:hypothetical protein
VPEPVAVGADATATEGPSETAAERSALDPSGTVVPEEDSPVTSPAEPEADEPPLAADSEPQAEQSQAPEDASEETDGDDGPPVS